MKIKTNVKAGGIMPNHNQSVAQGLKVQSNVKAGRFDIEPQHNQTMARGLKPKTDVRAEGANGDLPLYSVSTLTAARGLKVKTGVKAGDWTNQHNQTMAKGLKVKTDIKAGGPPPIIIED